MTKTLLAVVLLSPSVGLASERDEWIAKVAEADPADARAFEAMYRQALLALGDANGSGMLDHRSELVAVPCAVWEKADASVRGFYGKGLAAVYGLEGRTLYSGDRLGILETSREEAASVVTACVGIAPPTGLAEQVSLLAEPGSQPWDLEVRTLLVGQADANGSGMLEAAEVRAVDCSTWGVIDVGVRGAWEGGVRDVYGFSSPERVWIGYTLGVSNSARVDADAWLQSCGLLAESRPGWADLPAAPANLEPSALGEVIGGLDDGGSSAWDEVVRRMVVQALDEDASGAVDTPAELGAAGCDLWQALDAGVRERWPAGFIRTYSLVEADNYLGGLLGFTEEIRPLVLQGALACGVVDGEAAGVPDVAELAAFDTDETGLVDSVAELGAIGCPDWRRAERTAQSVRQSGILDLLTMADPAILGSFGLGMSQIDGARAAFTSCKSQAPGDLRELVMSVGRVPDGGSSAWDEAVAPLLLDALDFDASGQLDNLTELGAISCDLWTALDVGVRSGWEGAGLSDIYGFVPQKLWIGSALGFDESVRRAAAHALGGCGLVVARSGAPVDPSLADDVSLLSAVQATPGTTRWEQVVHAELLSYDLDASGALDKKSEVAAVPCSVWTTVDQGAVVGWGQPLLQAYGIRRGLPFEAELLGLAKKMRGAATKAIGRCLEQGGP